MQDYYGLEWIFEERLKKVNYMDMTISIHEETVLARFGQKLQLYRRFINNVLGIWLVDPNPVKDLQQWTLFIELMQD